MAPVRALLAALGLALALAATAAAGPARLHVYAATSLAGVLPKLDPHESYTFAGSSKLAAHIEAGANADVFASANTDDPAALYRKGLVTKPVVFAHNTIVVVVPAAYRAHITTLADLKRHGVKIEIADTTVALGEYTLQVLKTLHLNAVLANVVGRDGDVRTVLGKVMSGQVDAAFVYTSDAHGAAALVKTIHIPASAQPNIAYAAAAVVKSAHRADAEAFVMQLRSARLQTALRGAGFR
jgi:molybdate transport system substrate-binding protein